MALEHARLEVPEPVTLVGVKVHDRNPLGLEVSESATVPVKPLMAVMVTLKLAVWLGRTFWLDGTAVIWKSVTWTKMLAVV